MKKTYIIPVLHLTNISCERLIADSLGKYSEGADQNVILTKEDKVSSSSSYNVWNDDWSE